MFVRKSQNNIYWLVMADALFGLMFGECRDFLLSIRCRVNFNIKDGGMTNMSREIVNGQNIYLVKVAGKRWP